MKIPPCSALLTVLFMFAAPLAPAQTNIFPASGNVGIGTTSPQTQLHIAGSQCTNLLLDQTPDGGVKYHVSSRWGGYFTIWNETNPALSGLPRLAINPSGGVGVGTLFPYGALGVNVSSPYGAIGNNNTIALRNTDTTPWNATSILNYDASGAWYPNAAIDFLNHNHGGQTGAASIRFYTKRPDQAALNEAMRIDPYGNVGIGTTAPGTSLHIRKGGISILEQLRLDNPNNAADNGARIVWTNADQAHNAAALGVTRVGAALRQDMLFCLTSNWTTTDPTEKIRFTGDGNVGIGTTSPTEKLAVNGRIRAKEVIVETNWSDFVFAPGYRLTPLSEIERHIRAEKHLPGIPSAQEVAQGGVSLGDMQARLLQKVEELTLHAIEQEKEIQALRSQLLELQHH